MNDAARIVHGNDTEASPNAVADSSDTIESNDTAEGTSEQENHKGPSLYPPMLQWTTRLRDFLTSRGYEMKADELNNLREAEFIPPPRRQGVDTQAESGNVPTQNAVPQGPNRKRKSRDEAHALHDESNSAAVVFPEAFGFNMFWGCFNRTEHLRLHIYPRGTGIHSPIPSQQQRKLTTRGNPSDWFGQDVSLLWLSPSVFISTMEMSWTSPKRGNNTPLWLYTITLEMRHGKGTCSFHIYCIEYFQKYKRNKPSSPRLPLTLFRQVMLPLPVDFFTSIEFTPRAAIDCGSFFSQFLSCILPFAENAPPPHEAKNYQEYTELRFAGKLTSFQLEASLDHRYHPYVRLAFDDFDETSLDPVAFNYMLRHASGHFRHLKTPKFLIKFLPSEYHDESFTANPRLETLTIDWTNIPGLSHQHDHNDTSVSRDLLKGINSNPNFQRLNLRFDAPIYSLAGRATAHYFINASVLRLMHRVIPSHPSFKELTVEAKLTAKGVGRSKTRRAIDCLVSSSKSFPSGLVSSPNSFPDSLSHLSFQFIGLSAQGNRKPQISTALWDRHVIPPLAMNWLFHQSRAEQCHEVPTWAFSKKATQRISRHGLQPAASLLALKVRAINEGILYRKTTEHLPRDTSTTNASAIAGLLRMAIGEWGPVS
jgi:hypothetical protein